MLGSVTGTTRPKEDAEWAEAVGKRSLYKTGPETSLIVADCVAVGGAGVVCPLTRHGAGPTGWQTSGNDVTPQGRHVQRRRR